MDGYIRSEEVPLYFPLRDYLRALPAWDGRDRVGELAARISSDELWNKVFRRWLRGAVKGCKVVEFTSCGMSDGKSINVLNTAITFAETNVKVLLIDCDLRRPNINRLLARKSSPGLTNVLVNACSLEEAIVRIDDYNLDVIFSGYLPPNPSELLSSDAFAELMKTLKERYDYIFIDTPPVSAVIDAAVISKHTNGAVIVVRPGSTKKEELVNVVSQLEFADAKIVGFVLNCVEDEHGGYYYRGKYKYNYTYAYVHGAESTKTAKNTKSNSKNESQKSK